MVQREEAKPEPTKIWTYGKGYKICCVQISLSFTSRGVYNLVTYLQPDGSNSEDNETFEEGLSKTSSSSLLTHNNRSQLTVITHQYHLTTPHIIKKHDFTIWQFTSCSGIEQNPQLRLVNCTLNHAAGEQGRVRGQWYWSYLFGSQNDRNHTLRFSCLGTLVNQDGPETKFGKSRVSGTHTRATDYIRVLGESRSI